MDGNVGKTIINKPPIWEWLVYTYKNGDWGMVYNWFTHITDY